MLLSHLKLSIRVLLRRKFFTFVSLFGIGFTLTVLTLVAALYTQIAGNGAPETRLSHTLFIERVTLDAEGRNYHGRPGWAFLDRYCRDLPGVEIMSAYTEAFDVVSFVRGEKITSSLRRTDGPYWEALEFSFLEGEPFGDSEVESGTPVAVINESTRAIFFNGQAALGQSLRLGQRELRIVGVVEDVDLSRQSAVADVWTPLSTAPDESWRTRLRGGHEGMFIVSDRSRFDEIRREINARLERIPAGTLEDGFDTVAARPVTRELQLAENFIGSDPARTGPERFFVLLGLAAALFMLLPAMNLVSVNMSRIFERAGEIGVRKAFGASNRDLVLQFVLENVVLCLIGGLVGFVGALAGVAALNNSPFVHRADFKVDPVVFFVGLGFALVFGLVSGIYPAWRMSRLQAVQALKGELA